jgi:hypothetical protein
MKTGIAGRTYKKGGMIGYATCFEQLRQRNEIHALQRHGARSEV